MTHCMYILQLHSQVRDFDQIPKNEGCKVKLYNSGTFIDWLISSHINFSLVKYHDDELCKSNNAGQPTSDIADRPVILLF